jgi:DNA-binding transcriptional MerR regulator
VPDDSRYAIGDLADLGGVSRRTVRYYVQEGLLPEPYGVGRGNHYGREHLDQLLKVKSLQEGGRTLEEIRQALHDQSRPSELRLPEPALERTVWRRITLAPGVELSVASDVRLPLPGKLAELAAWCRIHFPGTAREEDNDA